MIIFFLQSSRTKRSLSLQPFKDNPNRPSLSFFKTSIHFPSCQLTVSLQVMREVSGVVPLHLDLDDLELDRASAGRQLSRQDFEDVQGTCTTTGYEVRLVVFGSDISSFVRLLVSSLSGAHNLHLFSSKST